MELIALLLRILLMCLSFFGLCAAARSALKLNRFIAPCFVGCSVICVLMFGGMLRVLKYAFYLLYFGGFAGLIYAYLIRRAKPDWLLIGLFTLFAGYLAWRMGPATLREWDDLSHWGLVARQLLTNDAFPDSTVPTVTFQAYPLGSAAFIYYVGKTICNTEGIYLFAQNFLYGLALLPILAHVHGNKKLLYPAAACLMTLLFRFDRSLLDLFVDWQLPVVALGAAASALYYRNDLRKALLVGIPGIIACVYIKSSGLFFMATTALILAWIARRCGCRRSRVFAVLAVSAGAGLLAYFLWTMHVRLSFDGGMASKHAVSLSQYAKTGGSKSFITILRIVKRMLLALIEPYFFQVYAVLFVAACFGVTAITCRVRPELADRRRPVMRGLWVAVGFYVVWHFMIFMTYVFSMSSAEALRLASYWRYSSTGLLYTMGLAGILMLDFLSDQAVRPARCAKYVLAGATAVTVAVAPWFTMAYPQYYPEFVNRSGGYIEIRSRTLAAKAEYDLPEDGDYLIYAGGDVIANAVNAYFRSVKYDLNSTRIHTMARIVNTGGTSQETIEYSVGYPAPRETYADPTQFLAENLQNYDALLVLLEDSHFEAAMEPFLETYTGETPIIFTYK